jgi:hypothetical protein
VERALGVPEGAHSLPEVVVHERLVAAGLRGGEFAVVEAAVEQLPDPGRGPVATVRAPHAAPVQVSGEFAEGLAGRWTSLAPASTPPRSRPA